MRIVILLCRMPYVTGTSVLGLTFNGGVLMACDTLGALVRLLFITLTCHQIAQVCVKHMMSYNATCRCVRRHKTVQIVRSCPQGGAQAGRVCCVSVIVICCKSDLDQRPSAQVNDCTIIGASGELSDFQYILKLLEELTDEDFCMDDGLTLTPKEVHSYLCRVLYNRRNKCVPLMCAVLAQCSPHRRKQRLRSSSLERQ